MLHALRGHAAYIAAVGDAEQKLLESGHGTHTTPVPDANGYWLVLHEHDSRSNVVPPATAPAPHKMQLEIFVVGSWCM